LDLFLSQRKRGSHLNCTHHMMCNKKSENSGLNVTS
jgi:hypothetical protein